MRPSSALGAHRIWKEPAPRHDAQLPGRRGLRSLRDAEGVGEQVRLPREDGDGEDEAEEHLGLARLVVPATSTVRTLPLLITSRNTSTGSGEKREDAHETSF